MYFHFPRASTRGQSLVLALIGLFLLVACENEKDSVDSTQAAVPVDVVILQNQTVTLSTELPGRVVAFRTAQVRPQADGVIEKRLFEEGASVKAGEQLYQIDPLRYQAALQTAQANLDKALANLSSADARYKRYRALLADKAVSQQNYDDADASFQQAQADVAQHKAALAAAQIDLRYTRVKAPISGRIGKSSVSEGALVVAQQADALATIHQLDPIYVDLSQAAPRLLALRRQMLEGSLSTSKTPTVRLRLEDGSLYEFEGQLLFSEMSVDATTGSVSMRASFPNPNQLLLPGMYVQALVEEGVKTDALLVPQSGVNRDSKGEAIALVVNAENVVEQRKLNTGRAIEGRWLVNSGLQAGDKVIVAGLQKIGPGTLVEVTPVNPASTNRE